MVDLFAKVRTSWARITRGESYPGPRPEILVQCARTSEFIIKTEESMTGDLIVLKSSLSDRAHALGTYLAELKADHGRSDATFGYALDVCSAYTRGFVKQLDNDWDEAVNRNEYQYTLKT